MRLDALREQLIAVARRRGLITYSEAGQAVGLDMESPADRNAIASLLDEINTAESAAGRPLISALVVHAAEGTPGKGFYDCARKLRRLSSSDRMAELEFWVQEVRTVHDFWSNRS